MNLKIRNIFITVLVSLFMLYFFYASRDLLYGFSAKIYYPAEGVFLNNSTLEVTGEVKMASFISLNGRPIFTDENGFFKESLILMPGLNIIELRGENKFGKIIRERREVVVK